MISRRSFVLLLITSGLFYVGLSRYIKKQPLFVCWDSIAIDIPKLSIKFNNFYCSQKTSGNYIFCPELLIKFVPKLKLPFITVQCKSRELALHLAKDSGSVSRAKNLFFNLFSSGSGLFSLCDISNIRVFVQNKHVALLDYKYLLSNHSNKSRSKYSHKFKVKASYLGQFSLAIEGTGSAKDWTSYFELGCNNFNLSGQYFLNSQGFPCCALFYNNDYLFDLEIQPFVKGTHFPASYSKIFQNIGLKKFTEFKALISLNQNKFESRIRLKKSLPEVLYLLNSNYFRCFNMALFDPLKKNHYAGSLKTSGCKSIQSIVDFFGINLLKVYFDVNYDFDKKTGIIHGSTDCSNGFETKNTLKSFDFNVGWENSAKKLISTQGIMRFLEGTLLVKNSYHDLLSNKTFMQAKVSDLFLNNKNKIFGNVSGDFDVIRKDSQTLVKGNLIINDSCCVVSKEALFTESRDNQNFVQQSPKNVFFDLNVSTLNAGELVFSQIKSTFNLDLVLKGYYDFSNQSFNAQTLGEIDLAAKDISVLGTKFSSASAKLNYANVDLFNPLFTIDMSTKIKRYNIKLNLFGSSNDLIVNTSSNPHLSQQQIMSLFFTGIPDQQNGLRHILSAFINDKSTLFSDNNPYVSLIKKITSPLPRVRILPCFSSTEGGLPLYASMFLDISENCIATVEKDITGRDDLRMSVEYLLSENLALKMSRNFKGFIKGLVEMKFKF